MLVNQSRLVERFIQMVETDSVSGQEEKMRDLLIAEFSARGLEAKEDHAGRMLGGNSGNLLVRIPGQIKGPTLLFAAHMDTVQPGTGIKAKVEGDLIKSAGDTILGSDDKSAIAALLEAYDVLQEKRIEHVPMEFLFTVREEQGLQGSRLVEFQNLQAQIGFVLDAGGDPGAVVIQSPGQNEMEYLVYGKAAHAGINPEEGINAIKIAAAALAKMPCGRIDDETTCNLGIIEGGTARNIVAARCRIKGEVRSQNRDKLNRLTQDLEHIFCSEVERLGGRAEVNIKPLYPEIKLSPEEEVVKLVVKAAGNIGLKPQLISTGGGSDASIINSNGIPCVNLGVGMRAVHTTDEHIFIKDLVNDARLILAIIQAASQQTD